MKNAVEIRGLRKSYGAHEVLKGLDFRVRQGEIFALLGVNGAGTVSYTHLTGGGAGRRGSRKQRGNGRSRTVSCGERRGLRDCR